MKSELREIFREKNKQISKSSAPLSPTRSLNKTKNAHAIRKADLFNVKEDIPLFLSFEDNGDTQ